MYSNRKHPQQSCFIPKTAIKEHGIYPKISGKGLEFTESLPESYLDSRLIWRAGKYYLAMPDNKRKSVVEIAAAKRETIK